LNHLLRATPILARVSVARHVAYRAELTIWVLTSILPLIMLALWNAVVDDRTIAGFGQAEMATYFLATLVCRQLTGAWLIWELTHEIRTGGLSPQLLRPLHPLYLHAIWMTVAMPFRMAVLTPVLLVLLWWFPALGSLPDPLTFLLFLVSISLAWALNFLVQASFGLLSFWVDKSDGLFGVWFSAYAVLSGYIAPLAFFPDAAQVWLHYLPFRSLLAVPVELLGGFLAPADAIDDLAIQLGWVIVFAALTAVLWRRGVVRYGAYGA
jgi:ABC-2 type transport system permease protein